MATRYSSKIISLYGRLDGVAPTTGQIGEVIQGTGTNNSYGTTNIIINADSLALPAGIWEAWAMASSRQSAGDAGQTEWALGTVNVSGQTSGNMASVATFGSGAYNTYAHGANGVGTGSNWMPSFLRRAPIVSTGATTVYLATYSLWGTTAPQFAGRIYAKRIG